MRDIIYTIMYRPMHPETGQVLNNTGILPKPGTTPDSDGVYQAKKTIVGASTPFVPMKRSIDISPDILCYISKDMFYGMASYTDNDRTTYYEFTFPKPIKLDVPNIWVEYNSYHSLQACVEAAGKLAAAFGAENIQIVKKVDHTVKFLLG